MSSDLLVDDVVQRAAIDPQIVRRALELCHGVDQHLVSGHFRRVRNVRRYWRDFPPEQIAGHLRLLAQLSAAEMVVVSVEPAVEADLWDVVVAGVDLLGVSACATGALAELGCSITQLEVITYERLLGVSRAGAEGEPAIPDHFLMAMRVDPRDAVAISRDPQELRLRLRERLKAAYWHLVRGDLVQARQQTQSRDDFLGQVIDSRFRIERFLGRGGMGAIYLATQLDLERPVAFKVLRAELAGDAAFVAEFQRECRLLAQVRSGQIVHAYAAGEHEGRCWIAMEYMAGGDIAHWMGRHGAASANRARRWLRQALHGLLYVHREVGIVHHDLKPNNLLLDAAMNLKIGDLGLGRLARVMQAEEPEGSIRGTLWYMSPEQARGDRTDSRSDLFSLGSTFYHIATGRLPFDACTPAEILERVARGGHDPLAMDAAGVPDDLIVVIDRLMQCDPARRYQSAAVALADLDSYPVSGEEETTRHVAATAIASPAATTNPTPRFGHTV